MLEHGLLYAIPVTPPEHAQKPPLQLPDAAPEKSDIAESVSAIPAQPSRIPPNMIVTAEVVSVVTDVVYGYQMCVTTPPYEGAEVFILCPYSASILRREGPKGRKMQLRIIETRGESYIGEFHKWADGRRLDLRDEWPEGTTLEAEVVGPHPIYAFLSSVSGAYQQDTLFRVRIRGAGEWNAKLGQLEASRAKIGRKLEVTVTGWEESSGGPWPRLRFVRWLN
jgi:hypothetical protein